ncbi:MAG: hypothetical protein OEM38_02965 [Gammaproteobacteria bacterium]|nr:hypothetical protein [Gammaproteobacteria bacterium]
MIRQLNSLIKTRKVLRNLLGIAVICFIFPSSGFALGLGGIKLNSTLNQKLDATIELLSPTEQELTEISIKLASPAVYARMGIDRTIQLELLKFNLITTDDGKHLIHVSTLLTVNEPFLNFLVEINWATGRLLREFTVLLDPPVFLDGEGASAVNTPEADLPPVLSAPPVLTTPSGVTEVDAPFEAIVEEKSQVTLEEAPQSAVDKSSDAIDDEISKILTSEGAGDTQTPSSIAGNSKSSNSLVYEKVKTNEILWRIAESMRPEDISVEQMMLALQRENPAAFYRDNVSFLKAGAVLRIEDTSTLSSISADQAILEIGKQHKEWLSFRKERQARNAVAAESANLTPVGDTAVGGMPAVTNVSNEPLLKLVTAVDKKTETDSEASNAVLEAAEEKLNDLNIELIMASEELEASKRENEDLVTRLNSLEEQMIAMQSLVQLKDTELAKLRSGVSVPLDGESILNPLKIEISDDVENNVTVTKVISKDKAEQTTKLWQDPLTLGTIIFAVLLVALGGVLIKRQSSRKQFVKEDQTTINEKPTDEITPEDNAKAEKEFITFNTAPNPDDAIADGLSPMTDISFDNTVFAESNEDLLDPMSEVDVYLTYEKFDKAEKLIKEAILSSPDRQELKLKLLEVYAASDNKDAFNSQVDEFYAAINGDESHPLWSQAINLANIIQSDNPLFASNVIAYEETEANTIDDFTTVTRIENESDNLVSFGSDKRDSAEDSDVDLKWAPDQVTEFTALNEDTDVLDTSIGVVGSEPGDVFDPAILDEIESTFTRESILDDSADVLLEKETESLSVEAKGRDVEQVKEQNQKETLEADDEASDQLVDDAPVKLSSVEEDLSITDKALKTEVSDADIEKAMTAFTEETIVEAIADEKIAGVDIDDKQESEITVSDVFDDLPVADSVSLEKEESFGDTSFFLLSDEVGTKLDLARAYIEMGDHEGASDLLNEVLNEGSEKQKLEAKELMEMTTA